VDVGKKEFVVERKVVCGKGIAKENSTRKGDGRTEDALRGGVEDEQTTETVVTGWRGSWG